MGLKKLFNCFPIGQKQYSQYREFDYENESHKLKLEIVKLQHINDILVLRYEECDQHNHQLRKKVSYYETQFDKMTTQHYDLAGKRNPVKNKAFKTLVIGRDEKCIMTGSKRENCEVAHIRPFSQCKYEKQRYDCHNGILLDAYIHKKFFDNYLISIHPSKHTIVTSPMLTQEEKEYLNTHIVHKVLSIHDEAEKYVNYHYMKFMELNVKHWYGKTDTKPTYQ